MRIVTTEFTSDSYAFDVVQPVRRATDPEGTVAGEKLLLRLEGPVSYVQIPTRKAATTTYTGGTQRIPQPSSRQWQSSGRTRRVDIRRLAHAEIARITRTSGPAERRTTSGSVR